MLSIALNNSKEVCTYSVSAM